MCGIIARVSSSVDPTKTLMMLKALEYRGYDSYGILFGNGELVKKVGSIQESDFSGLKSNPSKIEIAHTRWATHGGVSDFNAHPHYDSSKKFFVVMNGIIENYFELKKKLESSGDVFYSTSDTEVLPKLIAKYFDSSKDTVIALLNAVKKVVSLLEGEFSFVLKYENYLLAYKNTNPIIVGLNSDESFLCSDLGVIQEKCREYVLLEDNEIVLLNGNSVEYYNIDLMTISKDKVLSEKISRYISKDTKYYMEKEIFEQKNLGNILEVKNIDAIKEIANEFKSKEIILLGAGTSYHAAYYLHYLLLDSGIKSDVILASELENYISLIKDKLIVVYSQSGETADLISPLQKLKDSNEIVAITNTKYSTLDRMAKFSVYLNCGREIGVASTKAFTAQLGVNIFLIQALEGKDLNLGNFYSNFDNVISTNSKVLQKIVSEFYSSKVCFFLGRDKFYPLALEGALKLKEISYIHAQGYAAGELKHGTLALVETGVPVVILGTNKQTISNAIEVKTRGGVIVGIGTVNSDAYDYFLEVPADYDDIFSVILMQLLSYYMTLKLGYDPDKPRNLAKSVTVK